MHLADIHYLVPVPQGIELNSTNVQVHVFQLQEDGPAQEDLDDDDDISAANHWLLPSSEFHGLWESLVFDSTVKAEVSEITYTVQFVI